MTDPINYDLVYNELTKPTHDVRDFIRKTGLVSTEAILRELRTVWIGTPRQTGSTYWMAKKAVENEKALIITRDSSNVGVVSRMGEGQIDNQVYSIDIITNDPDAVDVEVDFDTVFVDDASYVLRGGVRDAFYSWVARNSSIDTQIVMVA